MSSSKIKTRTAEKCPVFGYLCELLKNVSPTYKDVMRHYNYVKHNLNRVKTEGTTESTVTEIAEIVARHIEVIQRKASIVVV